jgi:hypothetical protein
MGMNKKTISIILVLVVLGLSTLACSLVGGSTEKTPTSPALNENENSIPTITQNTNKNLNSNSSEDNINTNSDDDDDQNENSNSSSMNTEFPIPGKAKVIQSNPNLVMATVDMPIKEIVAYYRDELGKKGMTEYELLTAVTDSTFSLVFRSKSNEDELIIQGTDIGNNSVAFSMRYEDLD